MGVCMVGVGTGCLIGASVGDGVGRGGAGAAGRFCASVAAEIRLIKDSLSTPSPPVSPAARTGAALGKR